MKPGWQEQEVDRKSMLGTQEVHKSTGGKQEVHRVRTGSSQGADRKSINTRQEVYKEQIGSAQVHRGQAGTSSSTFFEIRFVEFQTQYLKAEFKTGV